MRGGAFRVLFSSNAGHTLVAASSPVSPTTVHGPSKSFGGHAAVSYLMNLSFSCPKCEGIAVAQLEDSTTVFDCPHCSQQFSVPGGAIERGGVRRCLVCPSTDLFIRKDFPQRTGVGIVVIGIVASTAMWAVHRPLLAYAVLFATAFIDLVLYLIMPDALMCYRCGAIYRGSDLSEHGSFNLETHERYRQQAARLAERKPATTHGSTTS